MILPSSSASEDDVKTGKVVQLPTPAPLESDNTPPPKEDGEADADANANKEEPAFDISEFSKELGREHPPLENKNKKKDNDLNRDAGERDLKTVDETAEEKTKRLAEEAKDKAAKDTLKDAKVTPPTPNKDNLPQDKDQQNKDTTNKRDYTGFSEEEAKVLSRMSNDSFNYIVPVLKEHKQIKEQLAQKDALIKELETGKPRLPDNIYAFEDAYTLDPTYKDAAINRDTAMSIYNHWKQQLLNCKAGKKWQDIVEKDGKFLVGDAYEPSNEAELALGEHLQFAQNQVMQLNQHINNVKSSYKTRYQQEENQLEAVIKEHFSVYRDPKHTMQPVIKKTLEMLPASRRKSKEAELLAYTVANNIQLRQLLDAEIKKHSKEAAVIDDANKAGPTQGDIGGAGSKTTEEKPEVTMDDFYKAMGR